MEASPKIRRSKSLKSSLSAKARRDSVVKEEERLQPLNINKPTLVQLRLTADDIALRPTIAVPPRSGSLTVPSALHTWPQRSREAIRPHTSSSFEVPTTRNTWPQGLRERKPGTYAFGQAPTLVKTPWEHDRRLRSAPRRSRSTTRTSVSSISSQTFSRLPREILHCILDHLRDSRISGSQLNVTSHRNDLRKLCVTSKQWHRVAREHLYQDIWLPWSASSSSHSTRHNIPHALSRSNAKLAQLLRTLEEAPGLAHLVKCLRIPSAIASEFDREIFLDAKRNRGDPSESVLSTVRDIIRRCPNLHSLSGHYFAAYDWTTHLVDALASRRMLKEHVWNLPRSASDWQTLLKPGALVDYHVQWRQLETLVLWKDTPSHDCLGPGTVTSLLQRLPSLKHLMLKGLSRAEFHNGTLLMLPALRSLRIENCPGITDHGLQQLVYSRVAMSVENFSLIDLEVTSLRTIQALLDNLLRLKSFRLIQQTCPELQELFSFTGTSFSLGSPTVEYIHWSPMLPGSATAILANSIAAGKFLRLRRVKIPCDHDSAVQKLCRPIQQRRLTEKDLEDHTDDARTGGLEYCRTAQFLEIKAQLRAKRARKDSVFSVTVKDEDGVETFHWAGSYLGSVSSNVVYDLEPDIEGQEYSHSRIEDLSRPFRNEDGFEQAVGLSVLF